MKVKYRYLNFPKVTPMHIILFIVILATHSLAQNMDTLVEYALKKHPSLESINQRLMAMDTRIAMSQNLVNPDVTLSINDIQLSDPLSRDLEPMQYEAIKVQQKFPWFGKLEAKKIYAQSKKRVIMHSYEIAKVNLSKEIRLSAYTLRELEVRIKILKRYERLTEQNIALYTAYASTEDTSHSSSVTASLLLSRLKIRQKRYHAIVAIEQSKLKYLVQKKVSSISDTLKIYKPKSLKSYTKKLFNNPSYQQKQSLKSTATADKTLKDLAHIPDPRVALGYFHRQAYNDYASLSIGISLPLYDSEAQNSEISRMAVLEASSESIDYKYSLINEIEMMHIRLNEAYKIYLILQNESLPQLKHLFELSQSSIQNGGDLFNYTSLLEQKLALEEELVAIKANYLRTEVKLNALIGEV
jgi:hypothetical protein